MISHRTGILELADLLRDRRIVVLSGAGCSTESGIPDYRGPAAAGRVRRPMSYQEFTTNAAARSRYWARSVVGWRRVAQAKPNAAHRALAVLEERGAVRGILTQNVDGLHQAAGTRRVVELHGSLAWVRCLQCGCTSPRSAYQSRLDELNCGWAERVARSSPDAIAPAPDGDAELPAAALEGFRVPGCATCGGILKPDVVFFGESVPRERLATAWRLFAEGEVLLVVGSSLTVYSGRRFVDRAVQQGMPIGIVNLGPTRADAVAAVRVDARAGAVLPEVAAATSG